MEGRGVSVEIGGVNLKISKWVMKCVMAKAKQIMQPKHFDPRWLTSEVCGVIDEIKKRPLPMLFRILADALMDAACDDTRLLNWLMAFEIGFVQDRPLSPVELESFTNRREFRSEPPHFAFLASIIVGIYGSL